MGYMGPTWSDDRKTIGYIGPTWLDDFQNSIVLLNDEFQKQLTYFLLQNIPHLFESGFLYLIISIAIYIKFINISINMQCEIFVSLLNIF